MVVSIYCLVDPPGGHYPGEPRYVGKAIHVKRRLVEHLGDTTSTHKTFWIRSLLRRGLKPVLRVIQEVDEEVWQEAEHHLIALFRAVGYHLTNEADGGEGACGFSHSDEARKKISDSKRGKPRLDIRGENNPMSRLKREDPEGFERWRRTNSRPGQGKDKVFSRKHRENLRKAAVGNTSGRGNKGKKYPPEVGKKGWGTRRKNRKLREQEIRSRIACQVELTW